jgi:hypothetical protein
MDDVVVGVGKLAGRGLCAARDFAAGEVIVSYQLRPLNRAEYCALPAGEELFVHSYGGRRYLYPSPARFVNHSDDPSCYEDFDRRCDIALRPVAAGDAITIDAAQETARELGSLLDAYRSALRRRSARALGELIDDTATLWLRQHNCRGRNEVVSALLGDATPLLSEVEWLLGTGRWEATCSAQTEISGDLMHVTMTLKVIDGNWQIVYHHTG